MRRKKHFTKDDAIFLTLIAIISVSFSYYTKGINEAVSALQAENVQVSQVQTAVLPQPVSKETSKTNILSPNGGEQWIAGETRTIRWEGIPNTTIQNQVEILLFPWSVKGETAITAAIAIIATSTTNSGTYEWTIPASIPAGDYFVRVFCITFEHCMGSAGDDSDASFRVTRGGISVLSPNGGEKIMHNSPLNIRWNTSSDLKGGVDIRLIGYIPGSDKIVGTTSVLAFNSKNIGTFSWIVSPATPADYTYYVSVSSSKNRSYEDRNDKPFSIVKTTSALTAYCAGTPTGQTMSWRGTISGGAAPYRYTWSGNEGFVGSGPVVDWRYENVTGPKQAALTVTSADGQEAKTNCSAALVVRGK